MATPESFLAQADAAERMAAVVSYERDRERLMRQAAEWRARAAALEAGDAAPVDDAPAPASWLSRGMRALFGPRRARGG